MRKIVFMSWICIIFISGCSMPDKEPEFELLEYELEAAETGEDKMPEEESKIMVYICGAIAQEGVYALPAGSRLFEAIEMAGGMSEEAATTYLNQAEPLVDGQRIYVPTLTELEEQGASQSGDTTKEKALVNINSASLEELMTLTGIGESKAQSIITYRKEQGGFQSIEDIKNIPGIKEGVYNKIKDYICV